MTRKQMIEKQKNIIMKKAWQVVRASNNFDNYSAATVDDKITDMAVEFRKLRDIRKTKKPGDKPGSIS